MYSLRKRRIRSRAVEHARWAVRHERDIHYAQVRPMKALKRAPNALPLTMDCSEAVTRWAYLAGAPDPNGLGYNGQGFTGTLLNHLPHISQRRTRRGDLMVLGSGTGEHVVMLTQGGMFRRDPLCASHGFEGGPLEIPVSSERKFHAGKPVTFLRLL